MTNTMTDRMIDRKCDVGAVSHSCKFFFQIQTQGFLKECNVDDWQGEGDNKDKHFEPKEDNLVLHVVEVDRLEKNNELVKLEI